MSGEDPGFLRRLIRIGVTGAVFGLAAGALLCLAASSFNPWFCYDVWSYILAGLIYPAIWFGAVAVIGGIVIRVWRGSERSREILGRPVMIGLSLSVAAFIASVFALGAWISTSNPMGSAVVAATLLVLLTVLCIKLFRRAGSIDSVVLKAIGVVVLAILIIIPPVKGVRAERVHLKHRDSARPLTLLYMIDGAEWAVINPLIEKGKMQTTRRMKEEGSWGKLESGPINGAPSNFTSLITGYNPDKNGVDGFYMNRWWLKRKTIFDFADDEGYRVGIDKWIIFWPPVHYKGFCIPGWQAWDDQTWPENLDFLHKMDTGMVGSYTVPAENELLYLIRAVPYGATIGSFAAYIKYMVFMTKDDIFMLYRAKAYFHGKFDSDVLVGLYRRFKTDIMAYAWYNLDPVSHVLWIYHEPEKFSRKIDPKLLKKYHNYLNDLYCWYDQDMGAALARLPEDTTVTVVSDHGFGADPRPLHMIYPVKEKELVKFAGLEGKVITHAQGEEFIVKPKEGAAFPPGVPPEEYIAERFRKIEVKELGKSYFTVQIVPTGVRVTRYGPHKLVDLSKAHLTLDGHTVPLTSVITVYYGSGRHYHYGILLVMGPHVQKNRLLEGSGMVDVTPTLSALVGLPIPEDSDGKILTDAIDPGWLQANPPIRVPAERSFLLTEGNPLY